MADVLEIKQKANGLIVYRKLAMDRETVAKPQGRFEALCNSKYGTFNTGLLITFP